MMPLSGSFSFKPAAPLSSMSSPVNAAGPQAGSSLFNSQPSGTAFNFGNTTGFSDNTHNLMQVLSALLESFLLQVFQAMEGFNISGLAPSSNRPASYAAPQANQGHQAGQSSTANHGSGNTSASNKGSSSKANTTSGTNAPSGKKPTPQNSPSKTSSSSSVSKTTSSATPAGSGPLGQNASQWKLTFSDEFNGAGISKQLWSTKGRTLAGNKELEKYTENAMSVSNGSLKIEPNKTNGTYTSGELRTDNTFSQKYGYFEIRAKMPEGKGMWPAFWLRPDNSTTGGADEIDVFEYIGGKDPNTIHMTNHWGANYSSDHHQNAQSVKIADPQAYHTYGINWEKDAITWYIDGKKVAQSTQGVPDEEMHMILNLAIGGTWPGNPDSSTPLGSGNTMDVDYVRVYQKQ